MLDLRSKHPLHLHGEGIPAHLIPLRRAAREEWLRGECWQPNCQQMRRKEWRDWVQRAQGILARRERVPEKEPRETRSVKLPRVLLPNSSRGIWCIGRILTRIRRHYSISMCRPAPRRDA